MLRNSASKNKYSTHKDRQVLLARYIATWNKWVQGDEVRQIREPSEMPRVKVPTPQFVAAHEAIPAL